MLFASTHQKLSLKQIANNYNKSKCCQHCNRSTLINYNGLKPQIKWQLFEIPYLLKELCKEPFF